MTETPESPADDGQTTSNTTSTTEPTAPHDVTPPNDMTPPVLPETTLSRTARKRLWTVAVIYLGVLTALAVTGLQAYTQAAKPPQAALATAQQNRQCPIGRAPASGQKVAQLASHGGQNAVVAFGRDRGMQERQFEYDVTDPSKLLVDAGCLRVQFTPFLRTSQTETAQLDSSQITADAQVSDGGDHLLVTVNFTRQDNAFGPAGLYSGTVSLLDPRVGRVDIPMTISLAYPVWQLPVTLWWLVLPVAIVYLWLLRGSFGGAADPKLQLQLSGFDGYVSSRNGILAIGAGATSALLVLSATYLSSASWGGDITDAFGLFGAMFAAFAAASTPVTAAGRDSPNGAGGQA